MELDTTDRKILNVLIKNPKMSLRDVSKQVDVSAVTVLKKIKNLEKENIIEKYTTKVNYDSLGYDISVIIMVRVSKGKLLEVEKKISAHKNVFSVYDITGDFDIMVICRFKNRRSLDAFLKKIQTYQYIERTKTTFILNTLKEDFISVE